MPVCYKCFPEINLLSNRFTVCSMLLSMTEPPFPCEQTIHADSRDNRQHKNIYSPKFCICMSTWNDKNNLYIKGTILSNSFIYILDYILPSIRTFSTKIKTLSKKCTAEKDHVTNVLVSSLPLIHTESSQFQECLCEHRTWHTGQWLAGKVRLRPTIMPASIFIHRYQHKLECTWAPQHETCDLGRSIKSYDS